MPVIILVGDEALEYIGEIENQFKNRYTVQIPKGEFVSIRSLLSNQDKNVLYLLSGLTKPERYEIFCLARKNEEKFLSIGTAPDVFVSSDKNQLVIGEYVSMLVESELEKSRIPNTQANRRSKGLTLRGVRDVKKLIKEINGSLYSKYCSNLEILKGCEERIIQIWSKGLGGSLSSEEIQKCYSHMVKKEMEAKGLIISKKQ